MMSIAYFVSGFMFLMASAGAVDGTAAPMWVGVLGAIGILLLKDRYDIYISIII